MVENDLITKIEVSLEAKDLNCSRSLQCIVYLIDLKTTRPVEYGRTEICKESVNLKWEKTFLFDYYFEKKQDIRFLILTPEDESIGIYETNLGQLVSEKICIRNFEGENSPSKIIIKTREIKIEVETITIQLRAHNVDKMDFFGKSDPYFILYKKGNETE